MLNPPNAYEQNKAFTKHIVDAMMKAFQEKMELEVSILRKLHDEWEPTIKVKIKIYEFFALCDLGASVSTIPKFYVMCLVLPILKNVLLICTWRILLLKSLWEELMMFLFFQIGTMCP